jgi:DNA invertase Pin-like site-specific DNA recombinase
MSKMYDYARVSTSDQDLTIQTEALKAAGCDIIRAEAKSGTTRKGRTELETLLDFVRAGDTLVVTRIDRLARSLADLAAIVATLQDKKVALRALEQPIDTGTTAGRASRCWASSPSSRRRSAASAEADAGERQGTSPDDNPD